MARKPFVHEPLNVFKLAFSVIPSLVALFANENTPFGREVIRASNIIAPNNLPNVNETLSLAQKGLISDEDFTLWMRNNGFEGQAVQDLIDARQTLLPILDYVKLFRKHGWKKEILEKYLISTGFTTEHIDLLLSVTEFFPSPADLIRFAVREVYTPDVVKTFGMLEDLPPKFLVEAKKVGVTDEHAKNFWGAHWSLPSPSQGFSMFHRDIISEDNLKLLLKSLDIMPFWRDKIIKLSYNLPTRVDVRRMYRVGTINENEVLSFYKKIGYTPKDAKALTEFTVINENTENLGLTKASVESAYIDDLITKDIFKAFLKTLKYSDKVMKLVIDAADYKKSLEQVSKIKKDLIELYLMGEISISGIRQRLLEIPVPTQYIDRVIKDVILEDSKRRKVPSMGDLTDWLNKAVITEEYYTAKMRLLGYKDIDIQNYLTEIAFDREDLERKFLSEKVYQRWLKKDIMSSKDFTETLTAKGISDSDIANLILETQE